ncbi:MAG: hypothetical protein CO114_05905 [Euryarchaeota archaeon CG_4_9_14_3_um_filter_38_12]|nr:MAG: hypothetical protein CO114_05905 [Euryarchaeota archaeon CG_4_9_14_3_um_filter_38_12]
MIGKEKIDEIVKKIADNIKPEKIVLFGSYAYGNPAKHSDLDLCVVLNEDIKNPDIGWEIRKLFWGWFIPMDIIVYTQKDIDEWKNVKMAFPTTIMRKGKVLYEKQ